MEIEHIPIDDLEISPYNTRSVLGDLESLEEKIKVQGVEPLIVNKRDGKFFVASGKRRLGAVSDISKYQEEGVPCVILEVDRKREALLVKRANEERVDLNALERANFYQKLLDDGIYSNQTELAEAFGVTQGRISQILSILNEHPEVQVRFEENTELSEKHLTILNRFVKRDGVGNKLNWLEKIGKNNWSAKELQKRLRREMRENKSLEDESEERKQRIEQETLDLEPIQRTMDASEFSKVLESKELTLDEEPSTNQEVVLSSEIRFKVKDYSKTNGKYKVYLR